MPASRHHRLNKPLIRTLCAAPPPARPPARSLTLPRSAVPLSAAALLKEQERQQHGAPGSNRRSARRRTAAAEEAGLPLAEQVQRGCALEVEESLQELEQKLAEAGEVRRPAHWRPADEPGACGQRCLGQLPQLRLLPPPPCAGLPGGPHAGAGRRAAALHRGQAHGVWRRRCGGHGAPPAGRLPPGHAAAAHQPGEAQACRRCRGHSPQGAVPLTRACVPLLCAGDGPAHHTEAAG